MDRETSARPKRWFRYGRDALLVLVVFLVVRWWQSPDLADDSLPPLQSPTLDGQRPTLASAEGPTVLHFWASWCGVCEMMAPNIVAVGETSRVLTVASNSGTDAEVAAFVERQGFDVPVVNDPDGLLALRYRVRAYPTTFVLDRQGQVVVSEVGYTTTWGLKARVWWAGL